MINGIRWQTCYIWSEPILKKKTDQTKIYIFQLIITVISKKNIIFYEKLIGQVKHKIEKIWSDNNEQINNRILENNARCLEMFNKFFFLKRNALLSLGVSAFATSRFEFLNIRIVSAIDEWRTTHLRWHVTLFDRHKFGPFSWSSLGLSNIHGSELASTFQSLSHWHILRILRLVVKA